MELEHRFELPVGVEKAFPALLDLDLIAPCFPGASLDSTSGDDFHGSVKIKVGPVLLNYKGTARFVEKDHHQHRAVIEATGAAPRSGSTATMLVHADAIALAPNRTAVVLQTTLSITGRAANFNRQVMIDVGNELISKFADCVSKKLTGREAGGATLLGVTNPDEVAAEVSGARPEVPSAVTAPGSLATPASPVNPVPPVPPPAQRPRHAAASDPVNVLTAAKAPLAKRVLPALLGAVVLVLVLRKRKRRAAEVRAD